MFSQQLSVAILPRCCYHAFNAEKERGGKSRKRCRYGSMSLFFGIERQFVKATSSSVARTMNYVRLPLVWVGTNNTYAKERAKGTETCHVERKGLPRLFRHAYLSLSLSFKGDPLLPEVRVVGGRFCVSLRHVRGGKIGGGGGYAAAFGNTNVTPPPPPVTTTIPGIGSGGRG